MVFLSDDDLRVGNRGIVRLEGADRVVYYVSVGWVVGYDQRSCAQERARMFTGGRAPDADVEGKLGGAEDDMRTRAVTYDTQGERFREYRDAVSQMQEDAFGDWPLEGPRTALWVLKFFARQQLTPTMWFNGAPLP